MSDMYEVARSLQRTNYAARKLYAGTALFLLIMGLISWWWRGNVLPWVMVPFFLGLLVFNERIIRRMRKAGIK